MELDGVREILSRGNGADRELRIFDANLDIVEVVEQIANATEIRETGSGVARNNAETALLFP